jgi:hypothetical protein
MKTNSTRSLAVTTLALAGSLCFFSPATGQEEKPEHPTAQRGISKKESKPETPVAVKILPGEDAPLKDRTWLGVVVEEASETLVEQLGLEPGVGLVVTHVSDDSPAAKAGLKKNDVLTELAGQALVLPAQLRKLVQARQVGDKVKLTFYRIGKKHTETATLDKAPARFGLFGPESQNKLAELHRELLALPRSPELQAQAKALREALAPIPGKVRTEVQAEIERSMAQARKAIEEAARELDQHKGALHAESGRLKELLKSGVSVDDNATVVVRSKDSSTRTIVKTDEWGTVIVVGPPNLHLTAHDKSGKVVFDDAIETADQRAKVPGDLWKRVEPLLEEKASPAEKADEPKKKED